MTEIPVWINGTNWTGDIDIGTKVITCADIYDGLVLRIGAYMILIAITVGWLIFTDILESRGNKGKSCLRKYRGEKWSQYTRGVCYAWLIMVAVYIIQIVWIGATT